MKEQYTYWMALAHMRKLWTKRKNEILVKCFNSNKSIVDFFSASKDEWISDYGILEEELPYIQDAKDMLPNYSFQVEDLINQGFDIIPIMSKDYPRTLKDNLKYNSPIVLYTKGNKKLFDLSCIAIVGSRNADNISLTFTDNIAKKVVSMGHVVVSGYAKGVDRQALDSALKYEGKSIVVLPQGIMTFGSGFKALYKNIIAGNVLVMSTFPPKAGWDVSLAMARNTFVYGLANEIYVSQSDSKGGTFSGVQDGLKRNCTIYVRKPNDNEKNANLLLIEMGAKAVDIEGVPIQIAPQIPLEEIIRNTITGKALSAKEIALKIFNDEKKDAIIKKHLKLMSKVDIVSRYKYTISVDEPSLF